MQAAGTVPPTSDDVAESDTDGPPNGDAASFETTVPQVDLSPRKLSVSVSVTGRSEDELQTVAQSALTL